VSVPQIPKIPDGSKAKEIMAFRDRIFAHLELQKRKTLAKRLYVAYHHFHPKILLKHQAAADGKTEYFTKTITNEEAAEIGLHSSEKFDDNTYIFPPSFPLRDVLSYIKSEGRDKILQCMMTPTNQVNQAEKDIVMKTPLSEESLSVKQRLNYDGIKEQKKREREESAKATASQEKKKKKLDQQRNDVVDILVNAGEIEAKDFYQSDITRIQEQQKEIQCQKIRMLEMEEKINSLEEKAKKCEEEKIFICELLFKGNHRFRLTEDKWHEENPYWVPFWLGMETWQQFKTFIKCLWPHTFNFPTTTMTERASTASDKVKMTELEQCMIARMRIRKGAEYGCLATIWGVMTSSIGDYCKKWVPQWGVAGRDLSILDICSELVIALMPKDFVDNKLSQVCAMVDGKDFMAEVERLTGGVQKAGFSDKTSHFSFRIISWSLPNGLCVEHTSPYYARSSEQSLVELWGKHISTTPVEAIVYYDERTLFTDDGEDFEDKTLSSNRTEKKQLSKAISKVIASMKSTSNVYYDDEAFEEIEEIMDESNIDRSLLETVNEDPKDDVVDEILSDYIQRKKRNKDLGVVEEDAGVAQDIKDINEANEILLKQGPNYSSKTKLRQLLRHELLHEAYSRGELKESLLTSYLFHMKERRDLYIKVLKGIVKDPQLISKCKYPTRLGKFEGDILGDRGFAKNAMYYPNMNNQITPRFIGGRAQFSEEELSDDKVTCSLRYAAEVLFSRCTDENILTDVVPRNAFSHFHHSIHWAHANANLGGEFESRN